MSERPEQERTQKDVGGESTHSPTTLEPPSPIVEVLERAGIEHQKAVQLAVQVSAYSFSGPLPPPAMLAAYDKVQSGLGERIVRMAETEGNHRRQQEEKQLAATIEDQRANRVAETRGQRCAVIVSLSAFVSACLCLWVSPDAGGTVAASVLGGGALVAITTALIIGRSAKKTAED